MYLNSWLTFEDDFSCWYYKISETEVADLEKSHGMLVCVELMDLGEEEN